jgi:hypothetical protein
LGREKQWALIWGSVCECVCVRRLATGDWRVACSVWRLRVVRVAP